MYNVAYKVGLYNAVCQYAELHTAYTITSHIPACLLVAENRRQILHFWRTVKFRGRMDESLTSELI